MSSPRVSWNLRIPLIGVTGSITGTDLTKPAFPAVVSIGGVNAMVEYVGSAPDAVTGLLQVNALVPLNAPTGPPRAGAGLRRPLYPPRRDWQNAPLGLVYPECRARGAGLFRPTVKV